MTEEEQVTEQKEEAPAVEQPKPEPVKEVPSDDYIQLNLIVGKHGGRTVRQGVVISRETAEKHKGNLKELVVRQLTRQLESAVDEIITFED